MNILISNDDGINAEGIHRLAQALSKKANIYISAPHKQRSANSQAISISESVFMKEINFENAKMAFETTGTPADCVKMGLQILKTRKIPVDMVFTGINHGSNLGTDTLYSGTVGAAMEAALTGCQAVAVSVEGHNAKEFDMACTLAVQMVDKIYKKLNPRTIININTPNLPMDKIKGIRFTRLGDKFWNDWFEPVENIDGKAEYVFQGEQKDYTEGSEDLDIVAINNQYASITPLMFDYTDHQAMEKIKKWNFEI